MRLCVSSVRGPVAHSGARPSRPVYNSLWTTLPASVHEKLNELVASRAQLTVYFTSARAVTPSGFASVMAIMALGDSALGDSALGDSALGDSALGDSALGASAF